MKEAARFLEIYYSGENKREEKRVYRLKNYLAKGKTVDEYYSSRRKDKKNLKMLLLEKKKQKKKPGKLMKAETKRSL